MKTIPTQKKEAEEKEAEEKEADKRFQPPRPYRSAEDTIHDFMADFQKRRPGELPKLAWLARVTGLSIGTAARYRKTFSETENMLAEHPSEAGPL